MPGRPLTDPGTEGWRAGARAGFYGKLPARGDFVRENLPRDFTDPWDAWWQRGLAETQHRAGEAWRAAWLEAPIWHFILPPGLCGKQGVLGIWLPSVDRSGRYFPLTIAAVAPTDWAPHLGAMQPFLAAVTQLGCDALEHDLAPDILLGHVQAAFLASADAEAAEGAIPSPALPGQATWWTEGGVRVAPRRETGTNLPEGDRFATLIDDAWCTEMPANAQPAEPS